MWSSSHLKKTTLVVYIKDFALRHLQQVRTTTSYEGRSKALTCFLVGLVSNNTYSPSIHPPKAHNNVPSIVGHDLKEVFFIHYGSNHIENVVRVV